MDVITPRPDEIDAIHTTYLRLVASGAGLAGQREILSRLAHTLIEREGLDAIILAGTELALVFNEHTIDFPNVDCARLHVDAILRDALQTP